MATDSLKKRYFAKLSANFVGFAISLVTEAVVPRGLGPRAYGDFSFLSNFFTQIVGFLDMGTATCFYTKLSQRQQDFGLVSFYLSLTGLICFLIFVIVAFVHVTGIYPKILPDQHIFYIYLAAASVILAWFVQTLNNMADAYGVTVSTEIARIIQKGLGVALVVALFLTGQLNLTHFFYYQYFISIFIAFAFAWIMQRNDHSLLRSWLLPWNKIKAYIKEFYGYSRPFFIVALAGLIISFLDRWMLQIFGGSLEQGFYALSYKIGAVCFLFTGAMTQLIMREFAIFFDKKDIHGMARLFRRYVPMLYAISAYFACFIAVQSSEVTYIMGGANFAQANLAVMVMAIYPIHQTYGQLSTAVFLATGQTGLYCTIAIVFTLIGLPLTYFLIAPTDIMGLNAGASGLAIKMVVIQFIGVNVQLYFNARLLGLNFWRYFGHQVVSIGALVTLAVLTGLIIDTFIKIKDSILISFIINGILYSILVAGLLVVFPIVFGLNRNDLNRLKQTVFQKVFSS
jgi:O-antigen/teichoic acid export membrane protein